MTDENRPTAIDLFCGCGGISCGLQRGGYNVIAGSDIDCKYMATFQHNFPDALALNLDLTLTKPSDFMSAVGIEPGQLDLLAGGPPCQGFSKNVPRKHRGIEDRNNLLIRTFLDYCETIEPKAIVMENVAEMRNGFAGKYTEEIKQRLKNIGYTVVECILNAAEYGIPQSRRRAFFLATRGGAPLVAPLPTHRKKVTQLDFAETASFVTVWDAIGDLPSVRHGEGSEVAEYACKPFSEFQKQVRTNDGKVRNHIARFLKPTQYARLAALKPGQGYKDLPDEIKVRSGYSGAYGRLTKTMLSPTITRWVFHPGSGRWGHPVDTRTLTIREAARIQGFPDDYEFVGSFVQQAGQIGNAVPPMLIEAIARELRSQVSV